MVPGDSRTSVQHTTCSGLTSGFGMRPGVSRKLWPPSPHDFDYMSFRPRTRCCPHDRQDDIFICRIRSLAKFRKNRCRVRRKVIAAWYGSRGLAYLSTAYYVFRLNFWVRNETRCVPKAMAAITTCLLLDALSREADTSFSLNEVLTHFTESQGPDLNRSVVDLQSTAWPLRHLGDRVG